MEGNNLPPSEADVAVVGAGPGGSAAAILCASAGLRVVLIEQTSFPRDRPGETLHPGVEPLLARLGVMEEVLGAGFLRHEGNWVQWEGEGRFLPFGSDGSGPWRGFQAWRADFDAMLLHQARQVGVVVLQPCRALAPTVVAGRIAGVQTANGLLPALFVIDAAGGSHWLSRKLGLRIEPRSPRLIARFGYVEGQCPDRDDAPSIEADADGWTWTARVRPGLYQWTRLSFTDTSLAHSWVPHEFSQLRARGPVGGADVSWRRVMPSAGPGYYMVGDAAAVLDPASSHGVLKGLMSGMYAAHCIIQVAARRLKEHTAFTMYDNWISHWFEEDLRKLRSLYAILPQPPAWC